MPTLRRQRIIMMNRRTFSAALVAGAAASLISTKRTTAASTAPVKARNVVLVHGLFADGSCWSEVIARLQAAGLNVTSVQNPLTTLADAVASAQGVLARQDGPTVLAGHSFSGMIVTEAGVQPNVSALVYVAARAPDAGEDYTALAKTYPTPPATAGIVFDGDEGRLSEEAFLRDFAGDLPEAKAKVLYAVQEPFQKALLTGKTTHAAWRSKPSYYAVSTEDRTINPDLERFMAKRMGAKTIEVKASHLSLISNPEELLGAAHAACFTMSFVRLLGMANFVPEQVDSKSEVVIDKDGDGFSITSVHLTVSAKIPGIDQNTFQSIVRRRTASHQPPAGLARSRGSAISPRFSANAFSP